MAIRNSLAVRNARLDVVETTIGTAPTLEIRSGPPPATIASADTGTVLATVVLPTDWMAAADAGAKAFAGTWQDLSADATGTAGHFRLRQGGTVHQDGLCGQNATAWAATIAYTVGQKVSNGGNVYRCTVAGTSAGAGGPTGTGGSIVDGTVTWSYASVAGGDMVLDNVDLSAGQPFTVNSYTWNEGNA